MKELREAAAESTGGGAAWPGLSTPHRAAILGDEGALCTQEGAPDAAGYSNRGIALRGSQGWRLGSFLTKAPVQLVRCRPTILTP